MNIRTSIIILLFSLVARAGITQPWYFNQVYNPNNTWAIGLSIIGTETGYFGCAVSSDTDPGFNKACTFTLGPSGEMTQWKCFGRYGADFYVGDEGSLIRCNNGFACFGAVQDWLNNDSLYAIFYRFDPYGDTLFTKCFNDDSYNHVVGRTCVSTSDGGFALAGDVSINSGYSDIFIIKIDSNGNEQWRNYLGTDLDDWAKSIIQTPDKGYAVGSWSWIPYIGDDTADPVVYKTDSVGNFEMSVNLGGPFMDDHAMLCNSPDSCIIALTSYADSMYNPMYASTRTNLIKIDLEGNIIWNKKYGRSMSNYISNIQMLYNGDVIACGYIYNSYSIYLRSGWLFRFNSDGDSLWYREYFFYPEDPPVHSENFLFDVSQSVDYGFVAVGQAYAFSPENPFQKMWVLKVDSVGCEIENCWVGIEEPGGGEAEEQGSLEAWGHGELVIWPNPARDIVDCRWSNFDGRGEVTLVINDIFGRQILSSTRVGGGREGGWQIDVSSLPPGIYIAVVKDGKTIQESAKFLVVR